MEPGLSASCYGGRPDATRRGTDRRAALVRFRSLVRDGGLPWVAKLDIASFFDAIPHGPLVAALRRPLANVFLTAFDRSLERAGIVFLRYLDDVTILAASPAALAAGLRTAIVAGRGKRPARQRYFRACRRINELFGYELAGRPVRCRIGKVRYVQPRQHAVLGHSELILEQMRRVDRTVRKWLRREFGPAVKRQATGRTRSRGVGAWRVRSAARMYEMEVQCGHARP